MLSEINFINALFGSVLNFILACTLGLFFIFQARRTNAKLLFYYGINTVGRSLSLGFATFIDLMTKLITGENMDGQLKFYLVWGPGAITSIFFAYVFAEILIPKKKWFFLSLIITLNTLYLLDLFLIHWTPHIIIPGELLDVHFANPLLGQKFPFRWLWFSGSYVLMIGFGLLYKAFGTEGILRKKYFYLSTGIIIAGLEGTGLLLTMVAQIFPISGDFGPTITSIFRFSSVIFAYLGLRATPEQRKKRIKKKITTKDSLFRIIERPEHISEEEVTYYREQKICLICKGKVAGFNIFLCPNCEALYHEECARALSTMENACWVCEAPIDKTKPTKPFKKVEEKKDVEGKK